MYRWSRCEYLLMLQPRVHLLQAWPEPRRICISVSIHTYLICVIIILTCGHITDIICACLYCFSISILTFNIMRICVYISMYNNVYMCIPLFLLYRNEGLCSCVKAKLCCKGATQVCCCDRRMYCLDFETKTLLDPQFPCLINLCGLTLVKNGQFTPVCCKKWGDIKGLTGSVLVKWT